MTELTSEVYVWVIGKGVIYRTDDFIHALNVGLAWVEFGVDKQDSFHHLPVSL